MRNKPLAVQVVTIKLKRSIMTKKTSYVRIELVPTPSKKHRRSIQMDKDSLTHTTWDCKYHIVFAPKFRRKAIYGKYKVDIGKILRNYVRGKE